jgi:hypothetical protein
LGYLVIFFKKALRKNKAFLGLINKIYKPL